jgi:hypothetical protein
MISLKMTVAFYFRFEQDLLAVAEALAANTGFNWMTSLWVASEFVHCIHKSEERNGLIYEFLLSTVHEAVVWI